MSYLPPPSTRSVPSSPKKTASSYSTLGGGTDSPIVRAKVTPLALAMRSRPPSGSAPSPSSGRATPTLRTSQSVKNLRSQTPLRNISTTTTPRATTPSTPTSIRRVGSGAPAIRTRSISTMSGSSKRVPPPLPSPTKSTPMSIKQQIALKRAEAKKATTKVKPSVNLETLEGLEDASPIGFGVIPEENIDLGRWSVKETIERARTTGALNLASRSLPCIPSALFEIHLGIKPEPLKLVPVEPPITTSSSDDPSAARRRADNHKGPSWYEAQDLEILKAWSNEIVEIQPEISMFGSLKTIDLRNNQLTFLPDSFADLAILSNLDLSHNQLASLPDNFWALPNLCVLNLSHNSLTSLPFNAPFAECTNPLARTSDPRGDWYSETITRATNSLPKLTSLDVSHNIISSSSIDHQDWTQLPSLINKLDLSFNPLGDCVSLLRALSKLRNLQELRCEHAEIGDESFPVSLFDAERASSHSTTSLFSHLTVLDLGETQVTKPVIEAVFLPPFIKQTIEFEVTADPPKEGTLRVITGKRIVKEAWEVEAERRARLKVERHAAAVNVPQEFSSLDGFRSTSPSKGRAKKEVDKEGWEIEAERGLTSAGAKRRARTAAGFADGPSSSSTRSVTTPPSSTTRTALAKKAQAEKERWEIEAEQGLLTEGGRRRARAAAAMAAVLSSGTPSERSTRSPPSTRSQTSTPATSPSPSNSNSSLLVLSNPKYYSSETRTLTLPPSVAPVAKGGYPHGRSFSLAGSSSSTNIGQPASGHRHAAAAGGNSELALAVPTPTLPLHAILTQAFSHTLTTLVLKNRRMDPSIALPCDSEAPFLPCLEELCLEGCNLMENVVVARVQEMSGSGSTGDLAGAGNGEGGRGKTSEKLLDVIPKLFPSLRSLDLSYNALGSSAFTKDVLSSLILSKPSSDSGSTAKKGLRQLRLRGNKLTDLNGFQDFAMGFKGFREVKEWRLEELDLRDNEIGRLPPEVGLLPLEVFLVDGNLFRVPPRRVWEREGTKGLLSWLRGRLD